MNESTVNNWQKVTKCGMTFGKQLRLIHEFQLIIFTGTFSGHRRFTYMLYQENEIFYRPGRSSEVLNTETSLFQFMFYVINIYFYRIRSYNFQSYTQGFFFSVCPFHGQLSHTKNCAITHEIKGTLQRVMVHRISRENQYQWRNLIGSAASQTFENTLKFSDVG